MTEILIHDKSFLNIMVKPEVQRIGTVLLYTLLPTAKLVDTTHRRLTLSGWIQVFPMYQRMAKVETTQRRLTPS